MASLCFPCCKPVCVKKVIEWHESKHKINRLHWLGHWEFLDLANLPISILFQLYPMNFVFQYFVLSLLCLSSFSQMPYLKMVWNNLNNDKCSDCAFRYIVNYKLRTNSVLILDHTSRIYQTMTKKLRYCMQLGILHISKFRCHLSITERYFHENSWCTARSILVEYLIWISGPITWQWWFL